MQIALDITPQYVSKDTGKLTWKLVSLRGAMAEKDTVNGLQWSGVLPDDVIALHRRLSLKRYRVIPSDVGSSADGEVAPANTEISSPILSPRQEPVRLL
jgi:hypothetical protein